MLGKESKWTDMWKESKWTDRACSGGVSDNFEQDLVKLEANLEAKLHEISGPQCQSCTPSLP